MKKLGQIRESLDDAQFKKLTALARAGLFDAKKINFIKRALDKDVNKMTPADKKALIELLETLMAEVLGSSQVYSKVKQEVMHEAKDHLSKYDPRFDQNYPTDRELPLIIILKRKAIRVYPDSQKVGLYYSQALDKYVSIPFGSGVPGINEETEVNELYSRTYASAAEKATSKAQSHAKELEDLRAKDKESRKSKTPEDAAEREARKSRMAKLSSAHEKLQSIAKKASEKAKSMDQAASKKVAADKEAMTKIKTGEVNPVIGAAVAIGNAFHKRSMAKKAAAADANYEKLKSNPKSAPTNPAPKSASTASTPASSSTPAASTPAPAAKPELTDTQKNVQAASKKTKSIAQKTGQSAKNNPNLSDKQKRTLVNNARRNANQALVNKRAAGIKESFKDKLGKKRRIEEQQLDEILPALGIAAGVAARAAAPVVGRALATGASALGRGALRGAAALGRGAARAGGALGRAAVGALGGEGSGDNKTQASSSTPDEPKILKSTEFSGEKAKTSTPTSGSVQTGVSKRDEVNYRKAMQNENVIAKLKQVMKEESASHIEIDGNKITINSTIAEKVVGLYESLNGKNKIKMRKMLNEGNVESFKKVVTFALSQV